MTAMRALGFAPSKDEISRMLNDMDQDANGTVEFEEFLALMCGKMQSADPRDELLKTFSTICDGGSKITARDLAGMAKELGKTMTEEDLQEWIDEADTDGDGAISEEEFLVVMKKGGIKLPVVD